MISSSDPTRSLGSFLRARRDELDPAELGLPALGGRRRVSGLRREEVAHLAAISHDYYARLEQGRITPSPAVLKILCDVLRLDGEQRAYLYELAGRPAPNRRTPTLTPVRPQLQRLLDAMTHVPAIVLDRRMDVLAWNSLAAAVYIDFSAVPPARRNYVHLVFTHPEVRALYADWDTIARHYVAALRRSAAQSPGDPRLLALVDELRSRDETFRTWWAAHEVVNTSSGTTVLHHPVAGELTLDWDTFTSDTDQGQHLMTITAPPHSPTHQALQFLSSWHNSNSTAQ
ncbi:helix-turn-helix domain-containing protein [Rhodococcus wratislaviensis]|uniref:helix-turn-helix domain-containing protein n=1 Tax=Rhodococcus wratislaviensis TaxID=44752 RepID=UPI00365D66D0